MSVLENKSNIYSRKALWKRVLVVAALIIVGVSFFYSSKLVKELSNEERKKVRLWADAIENKANTVNTTAKLFIDLAKIEKNKIELWAQATEVVVSSPVNMDPFNNKYMLLALDIIESNYTIPIIISDQNGKITTHRNLDGLIDTTALFGEDRHLAHLKNQELLYTTMNYMKENGTQIVIDFVEGENMYLYYKDSKILEELRTTFDKIQNSFVEDVISMAASTPVIYMKGDSVVAANKVDSLILSDSVLLHNELMSMSSENELIIVDLGYGELSYIYFNDSDMLKQLKYYSVIQTVVIMLFVLIGYWLFSIFRRSEQNNVWVGMAKETAHQLGTPLSSLMGWVEVLKMKKVDESIIIEMEKDVDRLNMITERFSKIGAKPSLNKLNVYESLQKFVIYFRTRSPRKVEILLSEINSFDLVTPLNEPLFHWVIENLCKNGIDAMEGKGTITIELKQEDNKTIVDVTDTGKGIASSKKREVFQPGFTSKERGWGLGLSLSKRIIKEYHNGKIWVKWSEQGKGTTFRIELKQ